MAVIKATKGGSSLGKAMDYVDRKAELTSGKDCPDDKEKALEQMQITKEINDKTEGRQYQHYVQSFEPGETNPQQAHEIGKEWAEKNFEGHEVYIATHTDQDHIHNHFIVNSVNHETGLKIQTSKQDLEQFKKENDRICEREGLSVPDRSKTPERGEVRAYDMNKYQTLAQGKSYIAETAIDVRQSMEKSQSKKEFLQSMNDKGYKVEWQDQKKHITFTGRDGHKVRAANLEKTFSDPSLGKEGIRQQLDHNREQAQGISLDQQRQPELKMKTAEEIKRESAELGRGGKEIGRDISDTLTGEKQAREAKQRELERKQKEQEIERTKSKTRVPSRESSWDRGR